MQIEFAGNVLLPPGFYLYTALVHAHRLSDSPNKIKSLAAFLATPLIREAPAWMGPYAGHISQTYFASSLLPNEVLRSHTLFGYFHLSCDKADAVAREESL